MSIIRETESDSYSIQDIAYHLLDEAFQESSENIYSFSSCEGLYNKRRDGDIQTIHGFAEDSYIIDILPKQDGEIYFLDTSFNISLDTTLLSAFEGMSINIFDDSQDFLENEISFSNLVELVEELP